MKKSIIGCEEWVSIAPLNIPAIKARVDSGAKTSSIQAKNIKRIIRRGEPWVTFDINPIQDNLSLYVSLIFGLFVHFELVCFLRIKNY